MMNDHFREAMEKLDVELARKLWAYTMPNLPQPEDDTETLTMLHVARTAAQSISFRARAYSHAWLVERSLPSQLPDRLRPRAERLYPITVSAVGLAVYNRTPIALAIRRAMESAVLDEGIKDPVRTKRAILLARAKARKQLLGIAEEV